jgi:hypothetical protein
MGNPDPMEVPFWNWMIRNLAHPYFLPQDYAFEEFGSRPIWTFLRLGQSHTFVNCDRVVSIGGYYDDHPDSLIYNDVVVRDLRGNVRVFGYPRDVFPPIDFHTATLIQDRTGYLNSESAEGSIIIAIVDFPSRPPNNRLTFRRAKVHTMCDLKFHRPKKPKHGQEFQEFKETPNLGSKSAATFLNSVSETANSNLTQRASYGHPCQFRVCARPAALWIPRANKVVQWRCDGGRGWGAPPQGAVAVPGTSICKRQRGSKATEFRAACSK